MKSSFYRSVQSVLEEVIYTLNLSVFRHLVAESGVAPKFPMSFTQKLVDSAIHFAKITGPELLLPWILWGNS